MLASASSGHFFRAFAMVSISLLARCDSKVGEEGSAATLRQALASPASVFGYESVDDWSSSAMLDSASTASQGSASLAVNGEGWTEVTSVELGSLGAVKDSASVDVMLPSLASWGEVRLIFKIPSIGEHWRELGSSSLVGLEPGVFHTLSFPVPEDLRTKLADEVYQDFRATVIINGPTGTYLLDRLDVLGGPGGPPNIGPTLLSFSLTLPEGVEPGEFTLAAAGQLQIKDRVEAYAGGELTPVYNAAGASELGADSKLGGLKSVGDVLLRNRAFIAGDVVSGGTIEEQYPGDVTILGSELENQEIPTHSISWSTVRPPAVGDVHLEPQTSKVLTPGSYDEVTVKSAADLYLRANEEYFFRTLTLEPDARLILENTAGQIFVYVDETFVHRGEIVGLGNAPVPDLLVALSGAGTAHGGKRVPRHACGTERHHLAPASAHWRAPWSLLCQRSDRRT